MISTFIRYIGQNLWSRWLDHSFYVRWTLADFTEMKCFLQECGKRIMCNHCYEDCLDGPNDFNTVCPISKGQCPSHRTSCSTFWIQCGMQWSCEQLPSHGSWNTPLTAAILQLCVTHLWPTLYPSRHENGDYWFILLPNVSKYSFLISLLVRWSSNSRIQ